MTSLAQYDSASLGLHPGDVIAFWGGDLISRAIELWDAGPSHVGIVRQGGLIGVPATIIESNINPGKYGIQTNPLRDVVAHYNGSVAQLALSLDSQKKINWQRFYAYCGAADGHIEYDLEGILEYFIRDIPILGSRVAQGAHKNKMVCSAWVVSLLTASGLLTGINWAKTTPQDLVEMNIYSHAVPLMGKPKLRRFNTV